MDNTFYPALALCGGGGKGAYQIGVMKTLNELGLAEKIECFSGTSVGALNAALLTAVDIETAEHIWTHFVSPSNMLGNIEQGSLSVSRDAIVSILDYIGIDNIKRGRPVYVCTYNTATHLPETFLLNERSHEDIIRLLLASSALPPVYSPVRLEGVKYVDGGATALGNTPVDVLVTSGYKKILILALDNEFNEYDVRTPVSYMSPVNIAERVNLHTLYPDVDFGIIKPSTNVSFSALDTVDFSQKNIQKRILLGQQDAKAFFEDASLSGSDGALGEDSGKTGVSKEAGKPVKRLKRSEYIRKVNEEIRRLAKVSITCKKDFEAFVGTSRFANLNVKSGTLGGRFFYEDIFECDGWRIQQHVKVLRPHYRILDENNVRRAWTLSPKELLDNLKSFKKHYKNL